MGLLLALSPCLGPHLLRRPQGQEDKMKLHYIENLNKLPSSELHLDLMYAEGEYWEITESNDWRRFRLIRRFELKCIMDAIIEELDKRDALDVSQFYE